MSAQRKPEMTPDEAFLQQAFKDGRATKQDASMKAIGTPDVSLQARVQHLDMDHCRRLERAKEATGSLSPIVLFRSSQKGSNLYLADGHHRHFVYKNLKCDAIPAYVIDSDAAELEALEFATMCNREMCLGRKPEDIKKAIRMLLGNEKWRTQTDRAISEHVGCCTVTACSERAKYCEENGIALPEFVERRDGQLIHYKFARSRENPVIRHRSQQGRTVYRATVNGNEIHLGSDLDKAKSKLKVSLRSQIDKRRVMARSSVQPILLKRGFTSIYRSGTANSFPGLWGWTLRDIVCVDCQSAEGMIDAVGAVLLDKQYVAGSKRAIIICYKEEFHQNVVAIAEKTGIEFMTPDELIASLGPVIPEELKSESDNSKRQG